MSHWIKLTALSIIAEAIATPIEEPELQLVEIKPDTTNQDKLKELLDKMNATLEKIELRKKSKPQKE